MAYDQVITSRRCLAEQTLFQLLVCPANADARGLNQDVPVSDLGIVHFYEGQRITDARGNCNCLHWETSSCRGWITNRSRYLLVFSARSRLNAALMRAKWVKACGKLPNASPLCPICSA